VVSTLTRVCPCVLAHPGVERADLRGQGIEERQAVGDDLPGSRREGQLGQPAAAWTGPVTAGPVVAQISDHGVDPVLQLGAQPHQAGPVPQQRRSWRTAGRAIHASGSRPARSSCAKIAASTLSFFSRAEAIALHRSARIRYGSNH
jgi:hypothetical protein